MNAFLIAALALLAGFVPLGLVCLLEREIDAVVALQLCGALTVTLVLALPRRGLPPLDSYFGVADRLQPPSLRGSAASSSCASSDGSAAT